MKNNELLEFISKLKNGTQELLLENDLLDLLKKKDKLVVKAGFDPSTSNMHLGHLVLLNKLKIFQDYGHKVIFLIGNFTGMIGDPTGKDSTRKMLNFQQIEKNASSYMDQVFKILDKKKTIIKYNADWLKNLNLTDVLSLMSKHTVARMLERDDFKNRYKKKHPISIHEFVYPLLQGYDSVHLESDIEIGGTDQKFNLLVGRELQKKYGKKQQIIMTLPLLEGTDGKKKMSKSLNNSIDISDSGRNIFGKIMSINDVLMWKYYLLILDKTSNEIDELKNKCNSGKDIKNLKISLAFHITKILHNEKIAINEKNNFENQFKNKNNPSDIKTIEIKLEKKELKLSYVMKKSKICKSSSEAISLIKQNAVKVNNEKILDINYFIKTNSNILLQVGKRKFIKIKIKSQ